MQTEQKNENGTEAVMQAANSVFAEMQDVEGVQVRISHARQNSNIEKVRQDIANMSVGESVAYVYKYRAIDSEKWTQVFNERSLITAIQKQNLPVKTTTAGMWEVEREGKKYYVKKLTIVKTQAIQ